MLTRSEVTSKHWSWKVYMVRDGDDRCEPGFMNLAGLPEASHWPKKNPKVGSFFGRQMGPLISGKSRLVKYDFIWQTKISVGFLSGGYSCFVSLDWFSCKKAGIWTNEVVSWEDTMFFLRSFGPRSNYCKVKNWRGWALMIDVRNLDSRFGRVWKVMKVSKKKQ